MSESLRRLYEEALAARRAGDLIGARRILERLIAARPARSLAAQSQLAYGVVLLHLGDLAMATEELERAAQLAAAEPELASVTAGYVAYNLGLAYRQQAHRPGVDPDRRLLERSLATYQQACAEFRREGMAGMLMVALHNAAWVACALRQPDEAGAFLDEAEPLCRTESGWWHQRLGRAYVDAVSGADHDALETCRRIAVDGSAPASVRSHACWLAGHIGLALGMVADAETLAQSAVDLAAQVTGESRCYQDAAALLRRVHLQRSANTGS